MRISNEKNMREYMLQQYPNEGCGFVVGGKFVPCKNRAKDPTQDFVISSSDYLSYKNIEGVVHSHTPKTKHPKYDMRTPSFQDMQSQKAMGVPWGIVGCDGENVSDPIWWGLKEPVDYMDRPYIPSVYDCLTLAGDYYFKEFGIVLPQFPRPAEWDNYKKTMITDGYTEAGFREMSRNMPLNKLQHGDIVLMAIRRPYVNHIGVITEDFKMLHQMENRYPMIDQLGSWMNNVVTFLRHKELE